MNVHTIQIRAKIIHVLLKLIKTNGEFFGEKEEPG